MNASGCSDQVKRRDFRNLLHPVRLRELVSEWLKEDTPSFDYGGFVVGDKVEQAVLLCKSSGVLAGTPFFEAVFKVLDCDVEWKVDEGSDLEPVTSVCYVRGKVKNLLIGERVALNCITRASGVASYARRLERIARQAGWPGEVAGTRKTTPGFRMVEKYSLLVGGISTHRYDLSSMVMLKDNHIWSAGNITQAVNDARSVCGFSSKIEVECRSLNEATEAAAAGADVVMLDNFNPELLQTTAKQIKELYPGVAIEASGGIDEKNITGFLAPSVDIVSLSRTTQGYDVVDFSFKICSSNHDPANPTVTSLGDSH